MFSNLPCPRSWNCSPRTNPHSRATSAEYGWLHCGPAGAGHFVKMVHNGVEYGIMQAYAEGFNILNEANAGSKYVKEGDAEVAPMENPEDYQYDIDCAEVAELWRRGSVIGSWLLDLTADVFRNDRSLSKFDGGVSDSGEGRWTVHAAVDLGVPAPVISSALYERFGSRPSWCFRVQGSKRNAIHVWRSQCDKTHWVCRKCGGKGCDYCHKGWECEGPGKKCKIFGPIKNDFR